MGTLVAAIIIALIVAGSVYLKRHSDGKPPWGWTIATFFITIGIMAIAGFALLMFAFSFER
jgi:RsiW-degrading membrane proteinase PrsW (M82 family)